MMQQKSRLMEVCKVPLPKCLPPFMNFKLTSLLKQISFRDIGAKQNFD